jgi:hypothetical protein
LIDVSGVIRNPLAYRSGMSDELIANIQARVEQCRRLAKMIGNEDARKTLLQMAEDAEEDIRRLQAARGQAERS